MREIKFRVWQRGKTCYMHPDTVRYMFLHELECEQYIVEQFTGLYDKNGIAIYDGDILRDKYGTISHCYWGLLNWRLINVAGCIDSGDTLKVIGNIHENFDLLYNIDYMQSKYVCECCGYVSEKLSSFKIVGFDQSKNPVYSCYQCPPFFKKYTYCYSPNSPAP